MDNYEPLGPVGNMPPPPPPPPPAGFPPAPGVGRGVQSNMGAKPGGSKQQSATDLNSSAGAPSKVKKVGGKKKSGKKKAKKTPNKSKSKSKSAIGGTAEKKDGDGDEEEDDEDGEEEEDPNEKKKDPTALKRKICYIVTGIMIGLSMTGMVAGGALMAIESDSIP